MSFPLIFVLGGAASGKSEIAERIVRGWGLPRIYIATAQAFDAEMRAKIAAHKTVRQGAGWTLVESPQDPAAAIRALPPGGSALLDCVTLWLSNRLLEGADLDAETEAFLAALRHTPCPLAVVSNEVGNGIVPDTALGRRFRNAQGLLNRRIAALADPVVGVMAGLPVALKGRLPEALA